MQWSLCSSKDPRWNYNDETLGGVIGAVEDARKKIEELKKKLGDPPDDLTISGFKD